MKLINILNQGIRNNIDLFGKFNKKYLEVFNNISDSSNESISNSLTDLIIETNKAIHNLVVGTTEDITNKYLQLDYIVKMSETKDELIEQLKSIDTTKLDLKTLEKITNITLNLLEYYKEGYFDMLSGLMKQAIKQGTEFNRIWI